MAIRKLTTIHYLGELGFRPEMLRTLKASNLDVKELILAARNDSVWQTYSPDQSCKTEANQLTRYPGISVIRAKEIIKTTYEAGFLLRESKRSRNARWLVSAVLKNPKVFIEHYENLESMSPEALAAIDEIVQNALNDQELQIVKSYFGLKDGHCLTLEEITRQTNTTKGHAEQLLSKALIKLRHPNYYPGLEVAALYSRKALIDRITRLQCSIRTLQQELNMLKANGPYPDLKIEPDTPIEELELNKRTYNTLARSGIHTTEQLSTYTNKELLNIRGLGSRQLAEIRNAESLLAVTKF
ncbi:MAG: DNA-directed RNA polymerase subunit alpha C-terminal domain-containing protein [Candidatus Saccharibacteria bacterium]|nr:DNA-directed RNA polymerase subunit alpha C-terminal domain-containing protein [Candidatus Saccharibacteria bacterium]